MYNYSRELLTDIINLTRLPSLCMAHVVRFKHFLPSPTRYYFGGNNSHDCLDYYNYTLVCDCVLM